MDRQLAGEILNGESDELADIKANLPLLNGFIQLAREIDAMPGISKRFYEDSRSLFQATSANRPISELEAQLAKFFGPPVKPAGQPLPRKMRKNPVVKYLGGSEKDQSLFVLPLKTGEFYGALWPWRRHKDQIEIHLGYYSNWMVDEDYQQLEKLVKRSLSHSAFQRLDPGVGGRIRGIGLPSFLQMAEMEQATFTLRVVSAGRSGQLHVKGGSLIAAETADCSGCAAAHRIISWEDATIEITPADPAKTDEIRQPLMPLLMESLKIRDEGTGGGDSLRAPDTGARRSRAESGREFKRLVRLERAPPPRMPRRAVRPARIMAALLGLAVVAACAWTVSWYVSNLQIEASERFRQLRAQVEKAESPDQKIALLQSFLESHPQSAHAAEIESQIARIRSRMEENDLELITLKISNLPVDEEYEAKAIALYGDFQEKYPNSRFQERIAASIRDIKVLLDQYYHDELVKAARLDISPRLHVYKNYLERFPKGRYQREVEALIQAMGRQHLDYLKAGNERCEQQKRLDDCLARYDKFIADFKGTPLAGEAAAVRALLQDTKDLTQLRKAVAEVGSDYTRAVQIYRDYLDRNPQSSQKAAVEKEMTALGKNLQLQKQWKTVQAYALDSEVKFVERIQRLDRYLREHPSGPYAGEAQELMTQLEKQRLLELRRSQWEARQKEEKARIQSEKEQKARQQLRVAQIRREIEQDLSASKRYKANGDGTFIDRTTGLTWTLLDSYQETGGCLTYPAAQHYLRTLPSSAGAEWRLPTASELAGIYKQAPFFPESGAEWYWSSEAYSRGYHAVADVVSAKHETVFQRENRRQDQCGAVRAIRQAQSP